MSEIVAGSLLLLGAFFVLVSAIGILRFPGRGAAVVLLNSLMGLPPVVVGLVIYLYLSRSGPLGFLGLLYTPSAMVIAQTVLIMPIVAALSRQVLVGLHDEYADQLKSLNIGPFKATCTVLWDGRLALLTVVLAGFGRAISEVGAVIIVGGNIDHVTRVMTTAIALETSRGELGLALGLGIILLVMALLVNMSVMALRTAAEGPLRA